VTIPTQTLPSGDTLPALGLGTYALDDDQIADSVRAALSSGYTHIDTAEGYHNEEAIGEVLAEYDRDDVFLTSKVLAKNLGYESLIQSCEASLERLETDYLDLYLIHWPNPAISLRESRVAPGDGGTPRPRTGSQRWRLELQRLSTELCQSHLRGPDRSQSDRVPSVVPAPEPRRLLSRVRHRDRGGGAPLARTEVFDDEVVAELAESYDKSPAQVILRWALDRDVVALPRSSTPEHVRANADLDWELDAADRQRLDERDRDRPVYDTPARDWTDPVYGIEQ